MDNPHDVHYRSRLYREERLAEVNRRRLERRLRTFRNRPGRVALLFAALVLVAVLFGAYGCVEAAADDPVADPVSPSASPSSDPGSSSSGDPNASSGSSASADGESDNASASAVSSASSSSPDASASTTASASPSSSAGVASYAGTRSASIECYTFYSDGTVELRHGGSSSVSDSGTYQGDEHFGEIVWDSGRWTSTVMAVGTGFVIDDINVTPVSECF